MKPHMGSGDTGETSLLGGGRVEKFSTVIEALGEIDEASSAIGLARSFVRSAQVKDLLRDCQLALQKCAAEVAMAEEHRATQFDFTGAVKRVEEEIALLERGTTRPTEFITQGTTQSEAALHLARTIVRRAERRVFALAHEGVALPPGLGPYINRLSDLLFDLAYQEASY